MSSHMLVASAQKMVGAAMVVVIMVGAVLRISTTLVHVAIIMLGAAKVFTAKQETARYS